MSILKLVKYKKGDAGWTDLSYEVPFDSNAGRVLFRTGFLLEWASLSDYKTWDVIREKEGKRGTDYIRVTNIRGKKTEKIDRASSLFKDYVRLSTQMLQTNSRPRKVEIQRIPSVILLQLADRGSRLSVADFDDGLMHIGTQLCKNHEKPKCVKCPVSDICVGYNRDRKLISGYTT